MLKICKKCDKEKFIEEFAKGDIYKGKQYYRYICKACVAASKRTGKPNAGRFQKGCNNWIGRKHSDESKKKIGDVQRGRKQKPETIEKRRQKHLGQRRKETRHSSRIYQEWKNAVKEKDGWKCQICHCDDRKILHSHHIIAWKIDESKRFDVSNGLTLCKYCHAKEETKHKKGKSFSKNTEFKKGQTPWNKGLKYGIS